MYRQSRTTRNQAWKLWKLWSRKISHCFSSIAVPPPCVRQAVSSTMRQTSLGFRFLPPGVPWNRGLHGFRPSFEPTKSCQVGNNHFPIYFPDCPNPLAQLLIFWDSHLSHQAQGLQTSCSNIFHIFPTSMGVIRVMFSMIQSGRKASRWALASGGAAATLVFLLGWFTLW